MSIFFSILIDLSVIDDVPETLVRLDNLLLIRSESPLVDNISRPALAREGFRAENSFVRFVLPSPVATFFISFNTF